MPMDMDFRWMSKPYEDKARADEIEERKLADRLAYIQAERQRQERQAEARRQQGIIDASQGATEFADRQAAASMGLENVPQLPFPNMSVAYNQVMQQRMAQEADRAAKVQRLKELEAQMQERDQKIQKMMDDPKMQLAVAMAMYGDTGMLQSMLVKDQEETAKQYQTNMDSLEDKMANDIFALGGASDDQFDKIAGALIPLYKDRFGELEGKGARSRLGGWDAWEQAIRGAKGAFSAKKAKEAEAKAKAEAQKRADKAAAAKLKG